MRFRFFVVQHNQSEFAIHEGYADLDDRPIAINGEPFTLYHYSKNDLEDIISMIQKDLKDPLIIQNDCEALYDAYDSIHNGNFSSYDLPPEEPFNENVIEFKRRS